MTAPLVGQPFQILTIGIPVNGTIRCNCGGDSEHTIVTIVNSSPAACSRCRKVYHLVFNPMNGKLNVQIGIPETKEAS